LNFKINQNNAEILIDFKKLSAKAFIFKKKTCQYEADSCYQKTLNPKLKTF